MKELDFPNKASIAWCTGRAASCRLDAPAAPTGSASGAVGGGSAAMVATHNREDKSMPRTRKAKRTVADTKTAATAGISRSSVHRKVRNIPPKKTTGSRSRRPGAKAEAQRAASARKQLRDTAESRRPAGKLGAILAAIDAPDGATLDELTHLTRWQKHTVRAAISRLRPRGHDCRLDRMDGRKAYRLVIERQK